MSEVLESRLFTQIGVDDYMSDIYVRPVLPIASSITFLFVPGSRPDRFDKAVASGADVVVLDLEDAVAPDGKAAARADVRDWLAAGGRAMVRVNGTDTPWHAEDVAAVASLADGAGCPVMLPKAESGRQLAALAAALDTGLLSPAAASPGCRSRARPARSRRR